MLQKVPKDNVLERRIDESSRICRRIGFDNVADFFERIFVKSELRIQKVQVWNEDFGVFNCTIFIEICSVDRFDDLQINLFTVNLIIFRRKWALKRLKRGTGVNGSGAPELEAILNSKKSYLNCNLFFHFEQKLVICFAFWTC